MPRLSLYACALAGALAVAPALADPPVVEDAQATQTGDGWRFSVTLSHPDTGWDHYADGWELRSPEGDVLGHRSLAHPHVEEQPFTRSLGGVTLPDGLDAVHIHARDNLGNWSETPYVLTLPAR